MDNTVTDTAILDAEAVLPGAEEPAQTDAAADAGELEAPKKKKIKIKGTVKAIHPDMLFVLFGIFSVIMAAIRSYQLMYIFEPDTGFYYIKAENSFSIPLLYAIAAISFLIYLVLSFLSAKVPEGKAPEGKNYYIGASSILFAITLVTDAMLRFSDVFTRYEENQYATLREFLVKGQAFPLVFETAFALLAALYFIVIAVSYIAGTRAYASVRVMAVTPVCWFIFRLIGRFIRAQSFISVSELFWELIAVTFLMLFFMEFARIMADVDGKNKLPYAIGFGLCGASAALMLFLSRLVTLIAAGAAYLSDTSSVEFCDLGAALFVVIFLLSCVHDLRVREHPAPEPVVAPEPEKPTEAQPPAGPSDDEVFRIADEYSNRYLRDEPVAVDPAFYNVDSAPSDSSHTL